MRWRNKIKGLFATYKELLSCKYTCIVATPYAFSLYLLYMPDDAWDKTFFCICGQMTNKSSIIPHVRVFNHVLNAGKSVMWRFRLECICKYFLINRTKIYAMDFLDYAPPMIGFAKYTCLEDGTGSFLFANDSDCLTPFVLPKTWWGFKQRIKYGPVYGGRMGMNSYCIDRLVTSKNNEMSNVLQGRKYTALDWQKLWGEASVYKKALLQRIFDVDAELISNLKSSDTLILTQPIKCKTISEQEAMDIYAPYIEQYKQSGVVIKPHPREFADTDYTKYFPQTYVLNTKLPMQILSAMGVHFKRAITIFSTAVSNLPEDTEIIWLGTEINEELYKEVGPVRLEDVIGKR